MFEGLVGVHGVSEPLNVETHWRCDSDKFDLPARNQFAAQGEIVGAQVFSGAAVLQLQILLAHRSAGFPTAHREDG